MHQQQLRLVVVGRTPVGVSFFLFKAAMCIGDMSSYGERVLTVDFSKIQIYGRFGVGVY